MAPLFLTVFLLISGCYAETLLLNLNDTILQYPGDFNCTGNDILWEIKVAEGGLGISMIANTTNLDPDAEEYLAFSSDQTMVGKTESVVYLTGALTDVRLVIPLVETAFLKFSLNCTEQTAFTTIFKTYEEKAPEPPVTTPNPNPPSGIDTQIAVHLSGKTVDQFLDETFLEGFKKYIQEAAFEFCEENKITFNETKLANQTIFIDAAQQCNDKWPNYEKCTQILLAVYVTNPRTEYELSISHLTNFWEEIMKKGLPANLGVQPYEFPDVSLEILRWVGWIFLCVVIATAVGLLLWRVQKKADNERQYLIDEEEERRRESIFRGVQLRNNPAKALKLAKHQKMPDFMSNTNDSVRVVQKSPLRGLFTKNSKVGLVPPASAPKPVGPSSPPIEYSSQANLFEEENC